MRNPFRRTKYNKVVPTRPVDPFPDALSAELIETVRNWSLRGVPTSAPITLQLIEAYYEARGYR